MKHLGLGLELRPVGIDGGAAFILDVFCVLLSALVVAAEDKGACDQDYAEESHADCNADLADAGEAAGAMRIFGVVGGLGSG
jgi:hypothetical protein